MLDARFTRLAGELIPTRDGLPSGERGRPAGQVARARARREASGAVETIAANAARCAAHMIATAGLRAVPA
jgi:hypothetical protein